MEQAIEPIPFAQAAKICKEVREKNVRNILGLSHWQCWGCEKYAKGDDKRRCFNCEGENTNRGCVWINKIYDKSSNLK